MSPKRHKNPDAFDDQTTGVLNPVPRAVAFDADTTVPVDIREMELAAERSRHVPDPDAPPRIIRRPATPPNASEPYARVSIAGAGAEVTLVARGVSPTGVALEIPAGTTVPLGSGAVVMVSLNLGDGSAELRLRANVAHLRSAKADATGGLSLRWDTSHPPTKASIAQIQG